MFTTKEQEENAHRDIAASKAGAIQRQRRASDPDGRRMFFFFFFFFTFEKLAEKNRDSFFCWIVFDVINRESPCEPVIMVVCRCLAAKEKIFSVEFEILVPRHVKHPNFCT